jgi:hypothetical protein
MRKIRLDYFLIWGHGIIHRNEILDIIRKQDFIKIEKILYHTPKSIAKLVKKVYSYDYAPFHHLKSKTQYLLNTSKEVIFIFVKNNNPNEDYFGEGAFRHIESLNIKLLKEKLRDLFNPRIAGLRTEDHIIHASDNEDQTNYILKYLGHKNGAFALEYKSTILNIPYYLKNPKSFTIKRISTDNLLCNIVTGTRNNYDILSVPLDKSPHFRGLTENINIYKKYIEEFIGGPLTEDYSAEKFLNLVENFKYLTKPFTNSYIVTSKNRDSNYLIHDGLHRAAILKYQQNKFLTTAVIP